MSLAQRVFHGKFGRVALLDMDKPLVTHAHSQCHVLLKVAGRDSYFRVRERRVPLTDRSAVLVNAWEPHCYDPDPGEQGTLILALYIEPAWLASVQQSLALSARADFFDRCVIDLTLGSRRLVELLLGEMLSPMLAPRERIEFMLFDILMELIEHHSRWEHLRRTGARAQGEFRDARIRRATAYLLDHLGDAEVIDDAARHCGLSRSHFFTLFRQDTGITPNLLLNDARMGRAFDWLEQERHGTLGQLSEQLGFSEQGHFTRFFRQHIGASPNQYRRVVDSYCVD